jgi:hypothetical protein
MKVPSISHLLSGPGLARPTGLSVRCTELVGCGLRLRRLVPRLQSHFAVFAIIAAFVPMQKGLIFNGILRILPRFLCILCTGKPPIPENLEQLHHTSELIRFIFSPGSATKGLWKRA